MPLPAAVGKLGWVPSVGRVGTYVEERQDRGGRCPRPDHQHAWDPGQETGFISHDLSQQLDVTSCFCPFQALPAPQVSSAGILTPLQVFQVVVALAAPLCISLTSMPMALGTSAVQAWLPRGPGHLRCPGLASPWLWAPPLSRPGFPVALAPPLSRPGFPVALGTSAVQAWLPRGPGTSTVWAWLPSAAPSQSSHPPATCFRCIHPVLAWGPWTPASSPREHSTVASAGLPAPARGPVDLDTAGTGRQSSSES